MNSLGTARQQDLRSLSDGELCALLRGHTSESDAAVDDVMAEVFARHHSSVLAYARTCCRDLPTAQDLAAEAFVRTYRAVAWGAGPEYAWRPYLLTCVRHLAAAWTREGARMLMSDDFVEWAAHITDDQDVEAAVFSAEEGSLVLRAYKSLPERWQAVLWHAVVENEPAAETAGRLGISAGGVGSLVARAREGLREAYLRAHLDQSASDECRHYGVQIAATLRRPGKRRTRDLDRHLRACHDCARAERDLRDLNGRLGALLLGGILLWKPAAFLASLGENGAHLAAGTLNGAQLAGAMKCAVAVALAGAAVTALVALLPAEAENNGSDRPAAPARTHSAPGPTPSGPIVTATPAVVTGTTSGTAPASPTRAPRPSKSAPTIGSPTPTSTPTPTAGSTSPSTVPAGDGRRRGSDSGSAVPSPEPETGGTGLGAGVWGS
ncbi:sigma-70 family RNA polymerase sigma factor [Streptomyces sp. NPDC017949]|uniref:sigma-70 family RNA polymerase sigma factor n=1 Tax=Streptomyces sp. NPDC017949 TaxID=3365020 RepID=UPI0037ACAF0C